MKIGGTTKVLCIIGNPVEHSLSPQIHNAAINQLDIPYVYVPFLANDIETAISGIRGLNIKGASVTIPFKEEIIPYLDEIDDTASSINSVNTVINDNGKLIGTSSDGYGAMRALKECVDITDKDIIIFGNGGSAMAIASTILLKEKVKSINIVGRNLEKVKDFVGRIKSKNSSANNIYSHSLDNSKDIIMNSDILINTTSVGMNPNYNHSIIDKSFIKKEHTVFDIVYTPKDTLLIKEAKGAQANIVYGYKMLLYQAVMQFEKWTKENAPINIMEKSLLTGLAGR